MNPPVCLILPVRSLDHGKQRLKPVLDAAQRRQLNQWFLRHMLTAAAACPVVAHTVVVSGCEQALAMAMREGAAAVWHRAPAAHGDRESALNAALAHAVGHVRRVLGPTDIIIASCDLPGADAAGLCTLHRLGRPGPGRTRCIIAQDKAGAGTNALFLPAHASLDFCFGPDSCRRHAQSAARMQLPVLVARVPGLAFDVDTVQDYLQWQSSDPADKPFFFKDAA